jgi:hypothetical protein
VSGRFVPIANKLVFKELDRRFKISNRENSPSLVTEVSNEDYIAIHYWIGDKRASYTRDSNLAGRGVFDPMSFKKIFES